MKQEFKPLRWLVKNFDINRQVIYDYDVLKYREDDIKKMKKKCATKEEFAEELRLEFQWRYWSRSEHELIIEITEGNRVVLKPWVGCRDKEKAALDVTDDTSFDWHGFAEYHIDKQLYKDCAKVDVFDQLTFANQFEKLVDYCWYTRLKYERKNPKFDK